MFGKRESITGASIACFIKKYIRKLVFLVYNILTSNAGACDRLPPIINYVKKSRNLLKVRCGWWWVVVGGGGGQKAF